MEKLLVKWERLCASSSASAVCRHQSARRRAGDVSEQSADAGRSFWPRSAGDHTQPVRRTWRLPACSRSSCATLTAQWLRVDEESLHAGLYGYNGILVGLALATFLAPSALMWVYVVLGAAVSVVVMLGTVNVVKPWGGALTFPFVLTTWLLLLATYGFSGLAGAALPAGNVVTAFQPYEGSPLNLIDLGRGVLLSISQVFLKASGVAALLLLAGLAVNSLAAAAFALGRRDPGCLDGTSVRRRKRPDHRRPSRLQPGPDGDRAGHRVLSAELAGRGLRCGGHGVHGHCAGGAERCVDAVRHSGSDRAFRARDMDLPASTPVSRANHNRVGRCRDAARDLARTAH